MYKNIEIFEKGIQYLLSFPEITREIIDSQLQFPQDNVPKTKEDLFKKLANHAKNRQGMPNSIGDLNKIKKFYSGSMPKK